MKKSGKLIIAAWYGDLELSLHFPEDWDIVIVEQKYQPALTDDVIQAKISKPINTPSLSELVKGKKRVAVLIDDIHRPTPVERIMPYVLNEVIRSGIKKEQIIIVVASACHRSATKEDFEKKLGADTVAHFKIMSHDCKNNLCYLGMTERGTPIYVNKFVTECDMKVGISGIYPHEHAGFGGGSKIIHPGVCGVETARYLHRNFAGALRGGTIANEFRADIEDIAERVGLDFSINVLLNQKREVSYIFCGDRVRAHTEGVKAARHLYGVQPIYEADIVITNIYPFDTSMHFISKGLWPLRYAKKNSSKIVVAACPEGLGYHALSIQSLTGVLGVYRRLRALSTHEIKHFFSRLRKREPSFIIFSPFLKKHDVKKMYAEAQLCNRWECVIQMLQAKHKKPPVIVAIYPCAPLQIPIEY